MPSALPDKIVEGGWIGQCNTCGAVHLRETTVIVNSFGVALKPGVYMGRSDERLNPPYRCDEVNRGGVRRTCAGMVIQVADLEPLLAAWRVGGVSAVRDILQARAQK